MAFTINDGVLEQYTEEAGVTDVVIPEGVTEIKSSAFNGSNITSVYIPDSVRIIGSSVFYNCKQLRTVRLSEQLDELKIAVFSKYVSLEKIVIPDSVSSIGFIAFSECERLRDITLPSGLSFCSRTAFDGTPWLEHYLEEHEFFTAGNILVYCKPKSDTVILPEHITEIEECCEFPKNIRKIVFSPGIRTIPDSLLHESEQLEEVVLPEALMEISADAFSYCSSLRRIVFPEGLTSISAFAFANCTALEDVHFPSTLKEIGARAFEHCPQLKHVTLPDNCTVIWNDAFSFFSIDEVLIPAHFTDGKSFTRAFFSKTIGNIRIAPENEALTLVDGVLYSKDMKAIYYVPTETEQINIPETVEEIADHAFLNCDKLTSVTLPQSVARIGVKTFQGCSSLTNISIPDGVKEVLMAAFNNCTNLKKVTLPDSLTSITAYAFANTAIERIELPKQLTLLGDGAFEYCEALTEVTMPETVIQSQFYEDGDWEGDCYGSYDVESEEDLLKSVFKGTPWLKSLGYAKDEEAE